MFGGKETLEGNFAQFGGSGAVFGKGCLDLLVSPGENNQLFDSKTRFGISFNIGFGFGAEGHARVGNGSIFNVECP